MPKENRFRVNPKAETAPQIKSGLVGSYRYAYARSADSRAADETGQDYLTFSESSTWFAFALCDGVSQSFFGEIAARILGDAVLRWLEALPPADIASPTEALSGFLGELTSRATQLVLEYPIPAEISPMLREVLEQKRELGSETTFLCGRIDLPGPTLPEGRLLLAWMGDSRLRLWGPVGERSAELGDTFHTNQRWSTRRGPVNGRPHVFLAPVATDGRQLEIVRVLAYSDGLSSLDDHGEAPSNVALGEMIAAAAESATSDDISLLEVWLGQVPDRISARPLPEVQGVQIAIEGSRLTVRWSPLTGAEKYEVQVAAEDLSRAWQTTRTSWRSADLSPGEYSVRVRALDALGVSGRWSAESGAAIAQTHGVDMAPAPTVLGRGLAKDLPPAPTLRGGGLGAVPTVPVRRKEARRWPVMGLLLVGLVLGAGGLILGLVSGLIPLPGRGEAATPTATWTVTLPESSVIPTNTTTPLPTTPASATPTWTLTLAPTWTPTLALSPTNTLTLTPTATEPVSVLPTPPAPETDQHSPLATPANEN